MSVQSGRIILTNEVRGDWPIGHKVVGSPGVHDAFVNPHGAVHIQTPNGDLGLKPNEFAWLEKPTCEIMPERCGNCGVYREVKNLIVEKCPNCGDDEYELYRNCRQI